MRSPDFHQVIWSVTGVQEEPDLVHEVSDLRRLFGAAYVDHPLVSGLVILITLVQWDVPTQVHRGTGKQNYKWTEVHINSYRYTQVQVN